MALLCMRQPSARDIPSHARSGPGGTHAILCDNSPPPTSVALPVSPAACAPTSLLFHPQEYESGRVVVPSLAEAVRMHRAPAPSDVQSAHTLLAAGASARRGVPPRPTPVAVSHERAAVAAAAGAALSASGKFETGAQRHFYMETQVGAHRATVAPCKR